MHLICTTVLRQRKYMRCKARNAVECIAQGILLLGQRDQLRHCCFLLEDDDQMPK
jgi:hypothetical protein